jgi:NADPH oxidase
MLISMLLLYTGAHGIIRQRHFEIFWYAHHVFIIFMLALYTHASGCFFRDTPDPISPFQGRLFWRHCLGYESWRWQLCTGGLYLYERALREVRSRRTTRVVRIIKHPNGEPRALTVLRNCCEHLVVVEIRFVKPSMKYHAGQWLFVNVPRLSRLQWHHFSITSYPRDPYVSVHIRQTGDFTRAVGFALGSAPSIRVDGPYGTPVKDVFANDIAILIGAGIGITPWASVLKNICYLRSRSQKRLQRVEFI